MKTKSKIASAKSISLLGVATLFLSLSPQVYAESVVKSEKSQNEMQTQLENEGLSKADAKYYSELNSLVLHAEKNNEVINVNSEDDLSDSYSRNFNNELKQRVLQKDKKAIKKAMQGEINLRTNGAKDIEKLLNEDLLNKTKKDKYTITYPDGSSITYSTVVQKVPDTETDKVETNAWPTISGPWNEANQMGSTTNYGFSGGSPVAGNYTSAVEWTYTSGVNYSKVKNNFTWKFKPYTYTLCGPTGCNPAYDHKVERISTTGASASYGIVTVANESYAMGPPVEAGMFDYIQAYTDVRFAVSGAFSASYVGLSLSVSGGSSWHQYAVQEVSGWSDVKSYAAQYK